MKKIQIHQFNPQIYPRKIWVVRGATKQQILDSFIDQDKSELMIGDMDKIVASVWEVAHRETGYLGVLVWLHSTPTIKDIAHESVHVADRIFSNCGVDAHYDHNEHYAYMVGFAADCIYQVVTGKFKD